MLIEHGLIPGKTLFPGEPGMEDSASIIPEDLRMNPYCPCRKRTCPLHGFCKYCARHHEELNRELAPMGIAGHAPYCRRPEHLARVGRAAAGGAASSGDAEGGA